MADFISGAVEWLSPDNDPEHWDLIEGQGSLFHPSFAGVSLGLLHGAQPDALVMCHEPSRAHTRGLEHQPLPALEACIDANLEAAALTNPAVRCAAVAVNTSGMEPAAAAEFKRQTEAELRNPCVDPLGLELSTAREKISPTILAMVGRQLRPDYRPQRANPAICAMWTAPSPASASLTSLFGLP